MQKNSLCQTIYLSLKSFLLTELYFCFNRSR